MGNVSEEGGDLSFGVVSGGGCGPGGSELGVGGGSVEEGGARVEVFTFAGEASLMAYDVVKEGIGDDVCHHNSGIVSVDARAFLATVTAILDCGAAVSVLAATKTLGSALPVTGLGGGDADEETQLQREED